jgi:hypothetical protein
VPNVFVPGRDSVEARGLEPVKSSLLVFPLLQQYKSYWSKGSSLTCQLCCRYEVEKPKNMMLVNTPEALEAAYQSADCLVVVEFFVPECPGCRKLFPKLKQIAVNNPDVRFVQVGPGSHASR